MIDNDLDELEKLIEEEEQEKKVSEAPRKDRENKDVLRFIRKFQIAPGPNKVPTYLIYHQYKDWQHTTWKKPWGKEEFFRTFKKHFEQKRSGNQRFYMINDGLDLSERAYEKAKKYQKGWQGRGKPKNKNKVSRAKQGNES
jgi:hypothetical protein